MYSPYRTYCWECDIIVEHEDYPGTVYCPECKLVMEIQRATLEKTPHGPETVWEVIP